MSSVARSDASSVSRGESPAPRRLGLGGKQKSMFMKVRGAVMMGMFHDYEEAETEEMMDEDAYTRLIGPAHPGKFATNYVSTTKYSLVSFLPLSLLEQFKRMANVYFLLIAILCCIPAISPLLPWAAVAPVVFVLSISMTRDGIEDYYRWKADEELNNKPIEVLTSGATLPDGSPSFREARWKDVQVGDIVKLYDRDWIPADLLLLCTSNEDGSGFIDTMDLDGETNLKRRSAHAKSQHLAKDNMKALPDAASALTLNCVPPSGDLYRFDGALRIYENAAEAERAMSDPSAEAKAFPVDQDNMVLRSARLRNTKWAVGLVVYTGQESKVMLNSKSGSSKQSTLEGTMNKIIIYIFLVQCGMSALTAMLGGAWISAHGKEHAYLQCEEGPGGCSASGVGFLSFWTYIILLNSLIPSSLIVTMEIVKVVHAAFITWDRNMCYGLDDDGNWRTAKSRTSALNEELGQIDFVFSDKTGTLTQNRMEFQQLSIRGLPYAEKGGAFTGTIGGVKNMAKEQFASFKQKLKSTQSGTGCGGVGGIFAASFERTYARMLTVCHTVLLEEVTDKKTGKVKISYNADSPDEVALVQGGSALGYTFTGTKAGGIVMIKEEGAAKEEEWEVLSLVPFSSHRKRMTVVVRIKGADADTPVHVWMKGADNVILDRCETGMITETSAEDDAKVTDTIKEQLLSYAKEGLRTLCFAARSMDAAKHKEWQAKWDAAAVMPPKERAVEFEKLAVDLEDTGFTLVGCSAIEDKLQDNVPETIVRLARAKIKFWMLTGDKQETAIEIGRSTNLLVPSMEVNIINSKSEEHLKLDLDRAYRAAMQRVKRGEGPVALVIDGATLNFVMEGDKRGKLVIKNNSKRFVELAILCQAVIVCRSSPLQKALVVMLVHYYSEALEMGSIKSLAIGDGANDVPMIRSANIGIGIAGLEGMQASRAADYAIQQFQDLDRLLLQHGRLSYYRLATMSTYFFYKSWVFTLPQWIFGLFCARSGQTYYEALYVPSFNMFFTSAPVFIRAILDHDIPEVKALPLGPELYHVGRENLLFNNMAIGRDFAMSVIHAYALFFLPFFSYGEDNQDLWTMSLTSYSIILATVTVRIIVHTRTFTFWNMLFYFGSLLFYIAWLFFYDVAGVDYTIRGAAPHMLNETGKFGSMLALAVGATLASEIFIRYLDENASPTNVERVRQASFPDIQEKAEECHKKAVATQAGAKKKKKKREDGDRSASPMTNNLSPNPTPGSSSSSLGTPI